ncbi:MAG: class II fructose-bisphosphate aldolase [Nitrospinae bacterium]|nr:class II fructose-bisphosphate aldolase [Nitrospinota bacterium]
MVKFDNISELKEACKGVLSIEDDKVAVLDEKKLRAGLIDTLVYNAVFGKTAEIRGWSRWVIKMAALSYGAKPASIQGLYDKMGSGEVKGFTVPAINIRGMTYDFARSIVRAAMRNKAGAFIFEIAKSEQSYTNQNPSEYAAVILAGALKEGYKGPIFIQGDHYQISAKNFFKDRNKEVEGLKKLTKDSVESGFYNIDIDSSTIVELEKPTIKEQQMLNSEVAAEMTEFIRSVEPQGVTVSVGGEIGEVGGKNSTPEEFRAYMDNYLAKLERDGGFKGISKISVQTGTSHGGVPMADGTIAKVSLDFDVLRQISEIGRPQYGISGSVQHGASTLPEEAFHKFPEYEAAEVHLATGFQNMIYDSQYFPKDLKTAIYASLQERFSAEKKAGDTEEQFIYKTRKKGFGVPFKEEFWGLPQKVMEGITKELEDKFDFLFKKLNVVNSYDTVIAAVAVPENLTFNLKREIEMSA